MHRKTFIALRRPAGLMLLAAAIVCGCEEDLIRDDFERPFSLYGVISPDLGTQSIRVYPIEEYLSLSYPDEPGITVSSTDLNTGEIREWEDSVEVEPNGQREFIFWSRFRPERGHRYRVEAVREDNGARSYAEVSIPPVPTLHMLDQDSISIRVRIEGENFRALNPAVSYRVSAGEGDMAGPVRDYLLSYQGKEKQVEAAWEVTVHLGLDRYNLQGIYNTDIQGALGIRCGVLHLWRMDLELIVADPAWDPPDGVFDPDLLVYPQTMSNVENGFGFVGGGYRLRTSLTPDRKAVEDACFNYVW